MQIVFNCGAHTTNCTRVLLGLQENQTWLDDNRIEVVPPKRHSSVFGSAIKSLQGGTATADMEGLILDSILMSENPVRAIMSTPGLLGTPGSVTGKAGLYPNIGSRLSALGNLFPSCQVEFFLAIRNPAALLSETIHEISAKDHQSFLTACEHYQLRWNDAIRRLAQNLQGRRLVIWCYEDLPMVWPEMLRALSTIPLDAPLKGGSLYIDGLLSEAGKEKLSLEMSERDHFTIAQRRELHSRLLKEYPADGALEQEINLPGWTQEIVDEVTQNYYRDVAEITAFPGVEFILP